MSEDITNDDLELLVWWLADQGYEAYDVAYAVTKPWKFDDELALAKAQAEELR